MNKVTLEPSGIDLRVRFIIVSMKRDNCIEVKHVSHLSVSYLSRFFGSVGPVSRV